MGRSENREYYDDISYNILIFSLDSSSNDRIEKVKTNQFLYEEGYNLFVFPVCRNARRSG